MAFSLLLLVPLLVFFFSQSDNIRSGVQEAQGQAAANALIESAERVYYSGPPSYETVTVTLPKGIQEFSVTNSSVVFTLRSTTTYDLAVTTSIPLIPTAFSTVHGRESFRVAATVGGVQITET